MGRGRGRKRGGKVEMRVDRMQLLTWPISIPILMLISCTPHSRDVFERVDKFGRSSTLIVPSTLSHHNSCLVRVLMSCSATIISLARSTMLHTCDSRLLMSSSTRPVTIKASPTVSICKTRSGGEHLSQPQDIKEKIIGRTGMRKDNRAFKAQNALKLRGMPKPLSSRWF